MMSKRIISNENHSGSNSLRSPAGERVRVQDQADPNDFLDGTIFHAARGEFEQDHGTADLNLIPKQEPIPSFHKQIITNEVSCLGDLKAYLGKSAAQALQVKSGNKTPVVRKAPQTPMKEDNDYSVLEHRNIIPHQYQRRTNSNGFHFQTFNNVQQSNAQLPSKELIKLKPSGSTFSKGEGPGQHQNSSRFMFKQQSVQKVGPNADAVRQIISNGARALSPSALKTETPQFKSISPSPQQDTRANVNKDSALDHFQESDYHVLNQSNFSIDKGHDAGMDTPHNQPRITNFTPLRNPDCEFSKTYTGPFNQSNYRVDFKNMDVPKRKDYRRDQSANGESEQKAFKQMTMHSHLRDDANERLLTKGNFGMAMALHTQRSNFGPAAELRSNSIQHVGSARGFPFRSGAAESKVASPPFHFTKSPQVTKQVFNPQSPSKDPTSHVSSGLLDQLNSGSLNFDSQLSNYPSGLGLDTGSAGFAPVRDQFRALSNLKVKQMSENEYKEAQLKFLKNASVNKMNRSGEVKDKRSATQITTRIYPAAVPIPPIGEQYPKLMKELNDSESVIPAYYRFQKQDYESCPLRDDLKQIKAHHFRLKYHDELNKPKHIMKKVEFDEARVDGTKHYEMRYFLTDQQKYENMKENRNILAIRNNTTPVVANQVDEAEVDAFQKQYRQSANIPEFDIKINEVATQNAFDQQYADGQILYKEIGMALPSARSMLMKGDPALTSSTAGLQKQAQSLVVSESKISRFHATTKLAEEAVSEVMPKKSYKKPKDHDRLKYINDNQQLLDQDGKKRFQILGMINKLRSSSEAKVSCCNLKVPKISNQQIKLQMDKQQRAFALKASVTQNVQQQNGLQSPGGKKKTEMTEASKAVIERKYKELQYRKRQGEILEQTLNSIDQFENDHLESAEDNDYKEQVFLNSPSGTFDSAHLQNLPKQHMQRFNTTINISKSNTHSHNTPTRSRKITSNMKVFAKRDIMQNAPKQTLMGAFHALSYSGTEGTTESASKADLKGKYEQVFDNDGQIQSLRAQLQQKREQLDYLLIRN